MYGLSYFKEICWNKKISLWFALDIVSRKKFANCTPLNFKKYFYWFHVKCLEQCVSVYSERGLSKMSDKTVSRFGGSHLHDLKKTQVRDQKQKNMNNPFVINTFWKRGFSKLEVIDASLEFIHLHIINCTKQYR